MRHVRNFARRIADKLLDNLLGLAVLAAIGLAGSLGSSLGHEFHHRSVVIAVAAVVGGLALLGLAISGVAWVLDLRKRAEYLEAQKALVYNALESVQQALGMDEDWDLDQLVERGVLGPVRGLLSRARTEDVRISVLIQDENRPDEWTMRWAAGHSPEGVRNYRRLIDLTLAGKAMREGRTVVIPDVTKLGEAFVANPRARRDFRSLVAHPVQINETVVGALSVVSTEPNAFVAIDVSFILVIAAVIDVLLAAEQDALTLGEERDAAVIAAASAVLPKPVSKVIVELEPAPAELEAAPVEPQEPPERG